MLYYVDYISHKGGVNNLQVVRVTLENGKEKTFTSLHKMAEKRARAWIKKEESVKYYFAGGMYYDDNNPRKGLIFEAVRPTGGLPYVTNNPNGLSLTSHHSSLYVLSNDLSTATLVSNRSGGVGLSPKSITLSEKLVSEFRQVILLDNVSE